MENTQNTQNDDAPVTVSHVRINTQPIAGFLDYLRWIATNETARRKTTTAEQLWAFYEDFVREGIPPEQAASDLGLPISPDWN